jgi:hypothetical protein
MGNCDRFFFFSQFATAYFYDSARIKVLPALNHGTRAEWFGVFYRPMEEKVVSRALENCEWGKP